MNWFLFWRREEQPKKIIPQESNSIEDELAGLKKRIRTLDDIGKEGFTPLQEGEHGSVIYRLGEYRVLYSPVTKAVMSVYSVAEKPRKQGHSYKKNGPDELDRALGLH